MSKLIVIKMINYNLGMSYIIISVFLVTRVKPVEGLLIILSLLCLALSLASITTASIFLIFATLLISVGSVAIIFIFVALLFEIEEYAPKKFFFDYFVFLGLLGGFYINSGDVFHRLVEITQTQYYHHVDVSSIAYSFYCSSGLIFFSTCCALLLIALFSAVTISLRSISYTATTLCIVSDLKLIFEFFIFVLMIALILVSVAYLLSKRARSFYEKLSEYECGFDPFDNATKLPFDVHFYIVGVLFLVFDVEIVLLLPWAIKSTYQFGEFNAMLIFLFVLLAGFICEWYNGALAWPEKNFSLNKTGVLNPYALVQQPVRKNLLGIAYNNINMYRGSKKENYQSKIIKDINIIKMNYQKTVIENVNKVLSRKLTTETTRISTFQNNKSFCISSFLYSRAFSSSIPKVPVTPVVDTTSNKLIIKVVDIKTGQTFFIRENSATKIDGYDAKPWIKNYVPQKNDYEDVNKSVTFNTSGQRRSNNYEEPEDQIFRAAQVMEKNPVYNEDEDPVTYQLWLITKYSAEIKVIKEKYQSIILIPRGIPVTFVLVSTKDGEFVKASGNFENNHGWSNNKRDRNAFKLDGKLHKYPSSNHEYYLRMKRTSNQIIIKDFVLHNANPDYEILLKQWKDIPIEVLGFVDYKHKEDDTKLVRKSLFKEYTKVGISWLDKLVNKILPSRQVGFVVHEVSLKEVNKLAFKEFKELYDTVVKDIEKIKTDIPKDIEKIKTDIPKRIKKFKENLIESVKKFIKNLRDWWKRPPKNIMFVWDPTGDYFNWIDFNSFYNEFFLFSCFILIVALLLKVITLIISVAYYTLAERKLMAAIQRRKGPNVVGVWGLLQPLADGGKLIFKELIVPIKAIPYLYISSPIIIFAFSFTCWAVVPGFLF
jgi:NADH:ubiquinone oxidoreductase subunit 3 (subunit A)